MATLTKHQIIEHLKKGELIINPSKNENGEFIVEPASYDLRAGTIIWKETNRATGESHPESKTYDPALPPIKQEQVTLQPGQVMFVITHEEVKMPNHLCGTVYAMNKFSREGILALTTGHIDPGVQCPIVVRLVNLRSIPYTFQLGEPIYTIVFHNLEIEKGQQLVSHPPISMKQTFDRTIKSVNTALGNALNDLSLTNEFVKKDEVGKVLWTWIKGNMIKTFLFLIGVLVTIATIVSGIPPLIEYLKKLGQ
jgi:deoxycytidine triphosphate deaminase